ncbi:flagellin [Anaerobiospirillum sp. NML120449]|uniref:flagellin N-terminal helical domain-containing protein n=1 Tax=Anaerobiospirillum sp. NML120449 TaxID=2932817 RepID=UPI001FF2AFDA|nr:flagellin [Anaerobiospirillum sp. NML120449]MCK0525303.1 flagellin [Anaerobiospirillum sp. NML120449]
MAVYVNTNVSSLNGRRYLNNVQNQLTTTYQRLSSGLRINSAKDDAAGLQISSRLTTQINGLNQGNRNASDGIALAQTIEGGMNEITGMLQKIRTLAVQSKNGTNTAEDRTALEKEATALSAEINRIASQTTFGGKTVLDGGGTANDIYSSANPGDKGKMVLQVGANKGDTIEFSVNSMKMSKIADLGGVQDFGNMYDKGTGQIKIATPDQIDKVIEAMDKMIAAVDGQRAGLGAMQNRLCILF